MIEGYDKWSIQSTDDLGGTYILELRLVITDLFIRGLNPIAIFRELSQ